MEILKEAHTALNFASYYPLLNKATADNDVPCPGYIYEEIIKLSYLSHRHREHLVDFLLSRLQVSACCGKQKVVNVLRHLTHKGHPDTRCMLRHRDTQLRELGGPTTHGGRAGRRRSIPHDGFDGTAQGGSNQTPQVLLHGAVQELLSELFNSELMMADEQQGRHGAYKAAALPGMGASSAVSSTSSKYQGFGSAPTQTPTVINKVRDLVDRIMWPTVKEMSPAAKEILKPDYGNYVPFTIPDEYLAEIAPYINRGSVGGSVAPSTGYSGSFGTVVPSTGYTSSGSGNVQYRGHSRSGSFGTAAPSTGVQYNGHSQSGSFGTAVPYSGAGPIDSSGPYSGPSSATGGALFGRQTEASGEDAEYPAGSSKQRLQESTIEGSCLSVRASPAHAATGRKHAVGKAGGGWDEEEQVLLSLEHRPRSTATSPRHHVGSPGGAGVPADGHEGHPGDACSVSRFHAGPGSIRDELTEKDDFPVSYQTSRIDLMESSVTSSLVEPLRSLQIDASFRENIGLEKSLSRGNLKNCREDTFLSKFLLECPDWPVPYNKFMGFCKQCSVLDSRNLLQNIATLFYPNSAQNTTVTIDNLNTNSSNDEPVQDASVSNNTGLSYDHQMALLTFVDICIHDGVLFPVYVNRILSTVFERLQEDEHVRSVVKTRAKRIGLMATGLAEVCENRCSVEPNTVAVK